MEYAIKQPLLAKALLLVPCLFVVTNCQKASDPNDELWETFKRDHEKQYKTTEIEEIRKKIFFYNKRKTDEHNSLYEKGERSFKLGINPLADKALHELPNKGIKLRKASSTKLPVSKEGGPIQFEATSAELPHTVDWREKNILSPIKAQYYCLACWAFVADDKCKFNSSKIVASITNYGEVKNGSEISLQEAVAFYGPISVSIDAHSFEWNYYTKGVFDYPNCTTNVDHGVLVVGYGTENDTDYWLVKNSYGETFGDKGFIKMARNKGNQCAIASYANFPIIGEWKPFSPPSNVEKTRKKSNKKSKSKRKRKSKQNKPKKSKAKKNKTKKSKAKKNKTKKSKAKKNKTNYCI